MSCHFTSAVTVSFVLRTLPSRFEKNRNIVLDAKNSRLYIKLNSRHSGNCCKLCHIWISAASVEEMMTGSVTTLKELAVGNCQIHLSYFFFNRKVAFLLT